MPASSADRRGFGIYIHWPFCAHKCPYCDFNSHVRDDVDEAAWSRALLAEFRHEAERLGSRTVDSIFFGGGTPSLMPVETVGRLLEQIAADWQFASDIEITLEANPTSVEAANFAGLADAGVNRLSLGIQALNDADLAALGRQHSVAEAMTALKSAKKAFSRVSFDLIYARPDQTAAQWQAELGRAIALADGHLSLYQLTIEPGTAFFGQHRRGELVLPPEEAQADLYEATQQLCDSAGLPAYEVSNHAAPGQESRHNMVYWRYGEYLGLGPGAHGRVMLDGRRHAQQRLRLPERWLEAVMASDHGLEEETEADTDQRAQEMLMMGLRLAEGVSAAAFQAETGRSLAAWLNPDRLDELHSLDLIAFEGDRLATTAKGRPLLNAILDRLLN
jgi:putative oxygen-independent coproporphyrinogen III oxidase